MAVGGVALGAEQAQSAAALHQVCELVHLGRGTIARHVRLEDAAHVGGAAAACSRTSVERGAEVAQVELVDHDRGDACGERAIREAWLALKDVPRTSPPPRLTPPTRNRSRGSCARKSSFSPRAARRLRHLQPVRRAPAERGAPLRSARPPWWRRQSRLAPRVPAAVRVAPGRMAYGGARRCDWLQSTGCNVPDGVSVSHGVGDLFAPLEDDVHAAGIAAATTRTSFQGTGRA